MAYTAGNLFALVNGPPGRRLYRYDTTDDVDDVEASGYFSNTDDDLNLALGDIIWVFEWDDTPFDSGSVLVNALQLIVTNVIARDAAASAGEVDAAQVFLATSLFSSLT